MLLKIRRFYVVAAHDIIMAASSFIISLYLRLGEHFNQAYGFLLQGTLLFTLICTIVFFSLRLYRGIWRYASLQDLIAITKAVTLAILIFLPAMFLLTRLEGMPRSMLFINWMVLLVLLGGPRIFYRMLKDRKFSLDWHPGDFDKRISVILIGINSNTEMFLREIARGTIRDYRVVGIVDDDKHRHGSQIYGTRIYGDVEHLPKVVTKLKAKGISPQKILFTAEHIDRQLIKNVLKMADNLGLTLAKLPNLTDFQATTSPSFTIKPIVIEDLLGRPQHVLDRVSMQQLIQHKRILITGCGGTIGGELTRQIASYNPSHITLVELCEYNLYAINQELEELHPALSKKAVLLDIRSKESIEHVFQEEKPELVFHAAALKHVPLMEENPHEAVHTNIIGTKRVADASLAHKVELMVMISTDKAVNPTNIMGATKRAAECYIQMLGQSPANETTQFITVRFGNVLGSSGSVIPLFQKQLAKGGPLTVTHEEMTRYFMTVREAVELVLQAAVIGHKNRAERSAIFVLDMGEPVRIKDLAEQIIKMAGLRPYTDIPIIYTGLRPGEKLYEELFYDTESPAPTEHASIRKASSNIIAPSALLTAIKDIEEANALYDSAKTLHLLQKIVPDYHTEQTDTLVQKDAS